ncbi:MAG: AAA family ATPase [Candidatus Pacearchaeota archaeon]|nr:AAA family ATPase [Candidatus Pacearchaeota archaeon]
MVYLICVAGSTGSGKSTLVYTLQEQFPELIEVIYFTDYQKSIEQVPVYQGMKNWDCLEAIDFDKLFLDLTKLKEGKDFKIMTKNEKYNPSYSENWKRVPHMIKSKKIIFIEGYMALANEKVRQLYDLSIFLDLSTEERMKRRRTKKQNPEYIEKILIPMQKKYVEPTKKFASIIINTQKVGVKEAQNQVLSILKSKNLI